MILRNAIAFFASMLGLILATPLILLGLPFWVISYATRATFSLCEPRVIRWPDIFEFDSALGWKAKANLDCYCLEERADLFHVITDSNGWPGKAGLAESRVVVLGDSHAFGYGVDHKASFLQLNPKLPLKAIGVPGYNQVQELLVMEQLSSQLKGKLLVWWIYVGNDLYDNLLPEMSGYRTPFVRQANGCGNWEIVTSHLSPAKWSCSSGRMLRHEPMPKLHGLTFLSERAYSALGYLIRRGRDVCCRAGARLVVMSIPAPFALNPSRSYVKGIDPDFPDRNMGEICTRLGVAFVPLKKYLNIDDYHVRDDHWTKRGHKRVVEVLWNVYCDYVTTLISIESEGNGPGDYPGRIIGEEVEGFR